MELKNYSILVVKPKEQRLLGTARHTWKDNIKKYLTESVKVWNKFSWLQTAWNEGLLWTQCQTQVGIS